MSRNLPSVSHFERPPVVEVAISVQFQPVTALRTPHLGLFWLELRDRFPKIQELPPLPPVIESFGPPASRRPSLQMRMIVAGQVAGQEVSGGEPWPGQRCMFLTESEDQVIQLQADRLLYNWRKREDSHEYPRFSRLDGLFKSALEGFSNFLERERLGSVSPNQCEITYVNQIVVGEGWERFGQIGEVLTICTPHHSDDFLQEPETLSFQAAYVIPASSGEPLGRLYISAQPAFRGGDNKPILVVQVTARGRPDGGGLSGAARFLETGHEWALRGFLSATSRHMHEVWKIRHAE